MDVFFDFSKRATRIYFGSEDILVSVAAVISISSGSPPPVLLAFHFATIVRSLRVFLCACFIVVTQSRGPPRAFFAGKTRSRIMVFSCVFTPTERSISGNDKFSFCASWLSSFASCSLMYSPFPYEVARDFRSFTLSGHHPLFARYLPHCCLSSQHTSATSSQDRLPRSIHFLINKDKCLPFFKQKFEREDKIDNIARIYKQIFTFYNFLMNGGFRKRATKFQFTHLYR